MDPQNKPIAAWIAPILQWASEHGWTGTVTSGYRTYDQQAAINVSGAYSTPAGQSNHESAAYPGGAVDVTQPGQLISVLQGYAGPLKLVGGVLGPVDPEHCPPRATDPEQRSATPPARHVQNARARRWLSRFALGAVAAQRRGRSLPEARNCGPQVVLGFFLARVVIIDDSLLIRRLLREILTEAGHEVVGEAEDGLRAPVVVRELRPDLVVLDLVMPGRSGMSALQHMLLIDPSLAVVVCSASLSEARVIEALRIGAKGFIVKPFDRRQVLDAVRCAVGCGPCDHGWLLADPHDVGARSSGLGLDPGTRPAVHDDHTIDRLHDRCCELAMGLRDILDTAVETGRVSLEQVLALDYQPLQGALLPKLTGLFDVSRVPAEGFDPPKFQTAYDTLVDHEMMRRMDEVLAAEPGLTFALPLSTPTRPRTTPPSPATAPATGSRTWN